MTERSLTLTLTLADTATGEPIATFATETPRLTGFLRPDGELDRSKWGPLLYNLGLSVGAVMMGRELDALPASGDETR